VINTTDSTQPKTKAQVERKTADTVDTKIRVIGDIEHTYDPDQTQAFIDTVFHTELAADAHRLVYTARDNNPGMPSGGGVANLIDKVLRRTTKARAMYFNASSCVPDSEGVLRHKRDLFSAFHVLVLDDIGTKIPLDSMPKALRDQPTYIIESSKGNFQYGYVLDVPVTDYDHAVALVQTAAMAKLTDCGGLMATKIVRLPAGINGKRVDDKRDFKVKLVTMDGPYWTPELLLQHINFELNEELVTWEKIVEGAFSPLAKKYHTKYLPRVPISQSLNGAIDPVLEWLYEEDRVLADSGSEWVSVKCPWSHAHTTGDESAGYKPIGRGEDPYIRGFNCFHEHCADNHTKEFIHFILNNSDFGAIPIRDASVGIFERYCFDETSNRAWRLDGGTPTPVDINGFRTKFNQPVLAFKLGSKGLATRSMTVAQLWLESPYRQDVHGVVHMPGEPRYVGNEKNGTVFINTFQPAPWGEGKFEMEHVDKFLDYVKYLIPNAKERGYFTDWLASKMQNPLFRGTGIMMVTPSFGIGRSTLGSMLGELVGAHNAVNVSFDDLLGATQYNYWEIAQLVTVSEAKESADYMHSKGPYKAYETLKQRIDTTNALTTVNIKYAPHRTVNVCTSYLILTQHADAVAIPRDDRRLTVISNPIEAASPQYFADLNAWIRETDSDGLPIWARHVYRWLRERKVKNPNRLMLPLASTGKDEMIQQGKTLPSLVCEEIAAYCVAKGCFGATQLQLRAAVDLALMGLRYDHEHKDNFFRNCFNDISLSSGVVMRSKEGVGRVRVFKQIIILHQFSSEDLKMTGNELDREKKRLLEDSVEAFKPEVIAKAVVDNMPQ
tara:strand:- start:264 stop:2771 length:2508 start_codon:yes stop_codon:yes gene_type:complete